MCAAQADCELQLVPSGKAFLVQQFQQRGVLRGLVAAESVTLMRDREMHACWVTRCALVRALPVCCCLVTSGCVGKGRLLWQPVDLLACRVVCLPCWQGLRRWHGPVAAPVAQEGPWARLLYT
jgi:hypothetical protein